jgi:hypothetical protein
MGLRGPLLGAGGDFVAVVGPDDRRWKMKNETVYEDCNGQISFIEPNKPQEYARVAIINPRNIGYSKHPLYSVWQSMKQRCHNSKAANYRFYGARGISVCSEWHDFQ